MTCSDRLMLVGRPDLVCGLPSGHEGNHRGTCDVYWTPVSPPDANQEVVGASGDDELFALRATWYVTHADGTEEDIVLEHGNIVEDRVGSVGQVLFERTYPQSDADEQAQRTVRGVT